MTRIPKRFFLFSLLFSCWSPSLFADAATEESAAQADDDASDPFPEGVYLVSMNTLRTTSKPFLEILKAIDALRAKFQRKVQDMLEKKTDEHKIKKYIEDCQVVLDRTLQQATEQFDQQYLDGLYAYCKENKVKMIENLDHKVFVSKSILNKRNRTQALLEYLETSIKPIKVVPYEMAVEHEPKAPPVKTHAAKKGKA